MGCGRSIRRPGGRGLMNRARHRVPFLSSAPERPGPSLPLRLDGFSDVDGSGEVLAEVKADGTVRIDPLGAITTGYGNRPYKGQTGMLRLIVVF